MSCQSITKQNFMQEAANQSAAAAEPRLKFSDLYE